MRHLEKCWRQDLTLRACVMISIAVTRDAEPELEPEPPEPTDFGRSRSRRNGLLGAGAGAVKNGAAPAPKRGTIVARKSKTKEK